MSKCVLGATTLQFLGHQVDSEGIRPLEEKVTAILKFPLLTSSVSFWAWSTFITILSRIVQQLYNLLTNCCQPKLLMTVTHCSGLSIQATMAFENIKQALSKVTLLFHPKQDAPTSIMTDASSCVVEAVLQQYIDSQWCPIAYFSKKLKPAEIKYSTFDRELLAVYLAIKHFRYFIEGRQFKVFIDHKPLTFSLASHFDHYTPRQIHHLDYILQFTTDIQYVTGSSNPVADALSRTELSAIISQPQSTVIDFQQLATAQQEDSQLQQLTQGSSSLSLKPIPAPTTDVMLLCDISMGTRRPYVPLKFPQNNFRLTTFPLSPRN